MLDGTPNDLVSEERTVYCRQTELDIVRGLSVLLMVGAHVFNQFSPISEAPSDSSWFLRTVSDLTGAFPGGAQCFMMIMGIVILFSTRSSGRMLMRRGLALITMGFVVGIIRILPGIVNLMISGDLVSFFPEYSYAEDWQLIVVTLFWQDILIFAGMALIFIGFVREHDISDIQVILITVAMMVINTFVSGLDTGNDAINILLGYFFGTTVFDGVMTTSRYPFLSWIVYPVAGYLVGKVLVRTTDKSRLYMLLGILFLIASLPLTAIGLSMGMFDSGFTGLESYHQGILVNLWCISLTFVWIVIVHFMAKRIPERYLAHPKRWSMNITAIYILHYMILSVAIQFLPRNIDIVGCLVIYIALFVSIDLISSKLSLRSDRQTGTDT